MSGFWIQRGPLELEVLAWMHAARDLRDLPLSEDQTQATPVGDIGSLMETQRREGGGGFGPGPEGPRMTGIGKPYDDRPRLGESFSGRPGFIDVGAIDPSIPVNRRTGTPPGRTQRPRGGVQPSQTVFGRQGGGGGVFGR